MTETDKGIISKLYDLDDRLTQRIGVNTLFYIGIANTLIFVATGSMITYIAASTGEAGIAVSSSTLFGIAAAVCMYIFTCKYGPDYRSGIEDSVTSVLTGSFVISILPLFITDVLNFNGFNAFLSFLLFILVIILMVLFSTYYTVFSPKDASN